MTGPQSHPAAPCPDRTGLRRSHRFELPARPESAARARAEVDAALRDWLVPEQTRDDAALVVSELVTNAVRHTPSAAVHCCARLTATGLVHLEVHDRAATPHPPAPRHPGPDDESGRGLLIVRFVARDWGAEASTVTSGNAVWATLGPAGPVDGLPDVSAARR